MSFWLQSIYYCRVEVLVGSVTHNFFHRALRLCRPYCRCHCLPVAGVVVIKRIIQPYGERIELLSYTLLRLGLYVD